MKRLAFISDVLFAFLCVFLFSLCLFRYLRVSFKLSFLLSFPCGALAAGCVWALLKSKRKYAHLKKSEEKQKEKLLLHLALLPDKQKSEFFFKLLSFANENAQTFGLRYVITPKTVYDLAYKFGEISCDDVATFYRLKTKKERVLICMKISNDAQNLAEKLNIQIKTGEDVYALVKENAAFPDEYLGETQEKNTRRKKQLRICFAKANGKRFFVSGAFILTASLFTPFPYYYLIIGSILLLTATLVRIFGYE